MLKRVRLSKLAIASFACSLAFSQFSQASEKSMDQLKIAIVDVQAAILKTNEGIDARAKIEKEVSQKRQDFLNQQNTLRKMQEELAAQQNVLSEADKLAKQKEFQAKFQAYQQATMNFEQESKQKEIAALQKIFQNIQSEAQKIAKQKNYDMVFDKSAAVLLYAPNTTDITSDVVSMYNSEHKIQKSAKE